MPSSARNSRSHAVADFESPTSEPAGLSAVLAASRPQLVRFFTGRTGSVAEAEDVVQEIWLHVAEPMAGPIANPLAYLHRVGMNIVLDRARANGRRQRREAGYVDATTSVAGWEAVDEAPSAFDALVGCDRIARLAELLSGPPEGAMRVFRRHRIEGASHAEIAAELGITRSTVEKHIAVALRHLRKALDA
ncbi:sigma-70 family RNA polymerase sigma factor [Sphingomonas ginsenosidivorax]|uniref:Sigma-70 family RNA polymerase sigma factor n=1 Tax=Sphingomonas ginsenosidivorax TaxID=862135 RepID=A0A5C6UF19_9SPHN|nr:sigma-70 family RNA polymerase sigma factor [Sphingomonas ginsenosidivorax]TXC71000.1 sigma-70 family RNA polymerase sigma factor [Sphingomonas ginsenosidivorax]